MTTTSKKPIPRRRAWARGLAVLACVGGAGALVHDAKGDSVVQFMTAKSLLEKNKKPTEAEIREGISGNICRCTGYNKIVEAVQYAAAKLEEAR